VVERFFGWVGTKMGRETNLTDVATCCRHLHLFTGVTEQPRRGAKLADDVYHWSGGVATVFLLRHGKLRVNQGRCLFLTVDFIESSRGLVLDDYRLGFC
jgi:hypothetical protein